MYLERRGLILMDLDFLRFYVWSKIDKDLYLSEVSKIGTWRGVVFEGLDLLIYKERLFMYFLRQFPPMPDILLFLLLIILPDL